MKYRPLGTTALQVSEAGLGTVELGMPYGLGLPSPPPDEEAIGLLRRALDLGVTYFDTAAAYGRSEELLGRAFAGLATRPVVATKVALREGPGGPLLTGAQLARHVESSVHRSLNRLQVHSLDLLQIHSADDAFVSEELLALMDRLGAAGLVRYWGASTYGLEAPLEALDQPGRLRAIQVAYSLLDRRLDRQILPRCRDLGVGVVIRSVFLQGVLSPRRRDLPPHLAPLRRAADEATTVAASLGIDLPALAVRFAAFESRGDVTLFGTASTAELDANLAALESGPLPAEAVAALRRIQVTDEGLLNPGNWAAAALPSTP
ncbi:MAG: aldo/keto reductase [Gemmatimonadota bacterium]